MYYLSMRENMNWAHFFFGEQTQSSLRWTLFIVALQFWTTEERTEVLHSDTSWSQSVRADSCNLTVPPVSTVPTKWQLRTNDLNLIPLRSQVSKSHLCHVIIIHLCLIISIFFYKWLPYFLCQPWHRDMDGLWYVWYECKFTFLAYLLCV